MLPDGQKLPAEQATSVDGVAQKEPAAHCLCEELPAGQKLVDVHAVATPVEAGQKEPIGH